MPGQTVLVTGGAGFLGSHLCRSLVEDGREVVCVDDLSSGRKENVEALLDRSNFRFVEADVRRPVDLPATDRVYHLASRASPKDFTRYPVQIALTNTEGTRHLLDHAREHDARFLYASTSEVYGDAEIHPQTETYRGNVNIRGERGCYDESKRFGETLTVVYHEKYGVDTRTARIFNTYGPRMRPDDGRVVPTFVRQALTGEDLTIYGDGDQTRSFCYVDDMVTGLRDLMDAPELAGEVVNLGRDNERTVRELADLVIQVTGAKSGVRHEPLPEDDPRHRRPDLAKARRLLDWDPEVPLEQGLKTTVAHFRKRIEGS